MSSASPSATEITRAVDALAGEFFALASTLVQTQSLPGDEGAVVQGVTYGSDMRLFTNHAGIPAILYGSGSVDEAHTVNESIDLAETVCATAVIALTMYRWSGGNAAHGETGGRRVRV